MTQVRALQTIPPSFDALMESLAERMAASQGDKILGELRALISKEFAELKNNVIERPMTHNEMAEFLRINHDTLYRWVREGFIPQELVHKVSGVNYYFPSQMVKHIKKS